MQVKIGTTDITSLIALGGLTYSRNDLDGPNAGRTLSGDMVRDKVASKDKWQIDCKLLTTSEFMTLNSLTSPEYVTVTISDEGMTTKTFVAYCSTVTGTYALRKDNTSYWEGVSFSLIER